MQDDIDMEPLHKLFIYRKKLVKPYIERLLKCTNTIAAHHWYVPTDWKKH